MKIITQIEKEFDTKALNINGFNVWQGLKGYLNVKLVTKSEPHGTLSLQQKMALFATSFMGFFNYFKSFDYWFFTSSINRRVVNGKMYDTYCDYPANFLGNSLIIETPIYSLVSKKDIASKNRISSFPLILAERLLAKVYNISNSGIFDKANNYLQKIDDSVNILPTSKRAYAQYLILRFLLFFKKPKTVFMVAPYNKTGYLKAFKEKGIKVVELQHAVINKQHYGYNSSVKINDDYLPDTLLTFGKNEEKVFENNGVQIKELMPIGRFYCDYLNESFKPNLDIEKLKTKYQKTIAVSLQDDQTGLKLIPFLIEAAKEKNDVLYLLTVRRKPIAFYKSKFDFPANMVFNELQDVYEAILSADFHLTAYSSCVLEAPAMGVRNIAVDIDGMATKYYGQVFENANTTIFVNDVEGLITALKTEEVMDKEVVKQNHKGVISPNYKTLVNNFLSRFED